MAQYHDCLMTYRTTNQNESLTVETEVTFVCQEKIYSSWSGLKFAQQKLRASCITFQRKV